MSLIQATPVVCTDACMPNYDLARLKYPATCAQAPGADLSQDACSESCETRVTCAVWIDALHRQGGCESTCTAEGKPLLYPDLHCKFDDHVVLRQRTGCVVSVRSGFVDVEGVSEMVSIDTLVTNSMHDDDFAFTWSCVESVNEGNKIALEKSDFSDPGSLEFKPKKPQLQPKMKYKFEVRVQSKIGDPNDPKTRFDVVCPQAKYKCGCCY